MPPIGKISTKTMKKSVVTANRASPLAAPGPEPNTGEQGPVVGGWQGPVVVGSSGLGFKWSWVQVVLGSSGRCMGTQGDR